MQCEGVVKILRVPINCRSFFFFVFILLVIHLSIIIIIIIILTCEQKKKEKKKEEEEEVFCHFETKRWTRSILGRRRYRRSKFKFDERKFTISKEGWFKIKILKINKFTHSFHTFPPYLAHFFNRKRNTKKYTHGER